jgi:hypothetical protein
VQTYLSQRAELHPKCSDQLIEANRGETFFLWAKSDVKKIHFLGMFFKNLNLPPRQTAPEKCYSRKIDFLRGKKSVQKMNFSEKTFQGELYHCIFEIYIKDESFYTHHGPFLEK